MEPHLQLKRFPPPTRLKPVTTRSVDQRLTRLSYWGSLVALGSKGHTQECKSESNFTETLCFKAILFSRLHTPASTGLSGI